MTIQLVNLRINRIIAHQVFERPITSDITEPIYSQQFTVLDPSGLNALQTRITEALGNDSHSIEMYVAQSDAASVYSECNKLLSCDDTTFVSVSQQLAKKLAQSQTSRNIPGGILVIFDGLVGNDNKRIVGLIKAEIQEGFGIQATTSTVLLTFIAKLLLTPAQKFYKIGAFVETDRPDNEEHRVPESYDVLVYDHNLMTRTEAGQAAKYFYETFLGCMFSPSNKKLTNDFFYNTRDYIENLPIENQDKLDLHDSLYSYLKVSQSNIIGINGFAQDYLVPELRDGYRAHMVDKKFPENAVTKDLEYLKNKLRKRQVHFTSQVSITAPSDGFDDLVKIRAIEEGMTIVAIKGTIERTE